MLVRALPIPIDTSKRLTSCWCAKYIPMPPAATTLETSDSVMGSGPIPQPPLYSQLFSWAADSIPLQGQHLMGQGRHPITECTRSSLRCPRSFVLQDDTSPRSLSYRMIPAQGLFSYRMIPAQGLLSYRLIPALFSNVRIAPTLPRR